MADTSDELLGEAMENFDNLNLFTGNRVDADSQRGRQDRFYPETPKLGGSWSGEARHHHRSHRERSDDLDEERQARDQADQVICVPEASKARILDPTGNYANRGNNFVNNRHRLVPDDGYDSDENQDSQGKIIMGRSFNENLHQHHLAVVDENYLVVGNYMEEHICQCIENGEYVDFSQLLPRDRLVVDEENRMETVNRNSRTYFVPAVDTDPTGITNFSRWEQAFRVFLNIYTQRHPGRASELNSI